MAKIGRPKKKGGKPKIKIAEEQVRVLASIHCTYEEIAAVCNCSHNTIRRRFKEVVEAARKKGSASLRREQFERALKGNVTLLIWLGKQYLGQSDKVVSTSEVVAKLIKSPLKFPERGKGNNNGNGDGGKANEK